MNGSDKSATHLLVSGAVLIAAAALVVFAGVIPRVLSDTYAEASPQSAAAAFRVQVMAAAFVVVALFSVAFRVSAWPRLAIAVLQVLSAMTFVLGMFLAMPGFGFLAHGPGMRGAVALLLPSAAAEIAAGLLVLLAALRLARLAARLRRPGSPPSWKGRLGPAILLSICSFFWMFLVGEGLEPRSASAAARHAALAVFIVGIGAYFLVSAYYLLRGLPRSGRQLWVLLLLNTVPLLTAITAVTIEPNRSAWWQMLGVLVLSATASLAGQALAARFGRLRGEPEEHGLAGGGAE